MLDKNGKEMVTGCVVEIKNAYFKTDNGLYFVEKSPEELGWLGSDYCLLKLKRNGQLSTAKKNICFWPIMSFVSDRMKSIEANAWNKEHATIEVRTDIDRQYIKEYFKEAFLLWRIKHDGNGISGLLSQTYTRSPPARQARRR